MIISWRIPSNLIIKNLKNNQMKKIIIIVLLVVFYMQSQSQIVPNNVGSKATKEEAQAALDFHNKVRKDVGVEPLEWSAELAAYAQAWADHLASDNCSMKHRPRSGEWTQKYGENIFWGSGDSYSAVDASESWYSEIKDFKYGTLTYENWYGTGHYTQMVWRNTKKVGIGVARCAGGGIIIVANYDPAGNYMGEKPY